MSSHTYTSAAQRRLDQLDASRDDLQNKLRETLTQRSLVKLYDQIIGFSEQQRAVAGRDLETVELIVRSDTDGFRLGLLSASCEHDIRIIAAPKDLPGVWILDLAALDDFTIGQSLPEVRTISVPRLVAWFNQTAGTTEATVTSITPVDAGPDPELMQVAQEGGIGDQVSQWWDQHCKREQLRQAS